MRLTLAEVRPHRGRRPENLALARACVERAEGADLVAFPELFLSGYSVGDRLHRLAISLEDPMVRALQELAHDRKTWLLLGTPFTDPSHAGEVQNVALLVGPEGSTHVQGKRYLPTFGPFEEGRIFTPAPDRKVADTPLGKIGLEICYEVFFPEVSRALALGGADLLLAISASPITSRSLFEKLLPARAIENAAPVAYVNRVGVEDALVFGGGSGAWDPRGDPLVPRVTDLGPDGRLLEFELPLSEYRHYRPMRPVLRDITALP